MIPAIEARTGQGFRYLPVLLGGLVKLANNRSPAEAFAGIHNKRAYERPEMERCIRRHGLDAYRFTPHFPVDTLKFMCGAVTAQALACFEPCFDAVHAALWEQRRDMVNQAQTQSAWLRRGSMARHCRSRRRGPRSRPGCWPKPKARTPAAPSTRRPSSSTARSTSARTGLPNKGAYLALDGKVRYRGDGGYFADLVAADLGIDTRWLDIQGGREGLNRLRFGFAEIPRYFAEGARTPFRGNGGNVLTLPVGVGFPAASTAAMPLATTLQPLELGYLAKRYDLSGAWMGQDNFTYRVGLRRDVRDGTKPTAGSFFSTASQLASPVDQTTDQFEAAVSYASTNLQATLAYQYSQFKNGFASLTWDNPFNPAAPGAVQGQLALEPDNSFQQIVGSIGYQIMPTLRASADFAFGRGTQNADYLASTVNAVLAPTVPPLPSQSLDGKVNTYNGNVKLTYLPMENLRLNGVYAWNVRDNDTAVQSYPIASTSMFLNPVPRSNTPFDLTQNLFKLNADYRGPGTWRLNGGIDWDDRDYTYTAVVNTLETTLWGRASVQALENLGLSFNLAYGDRNPSTYGVAYWFPDPQNPLMRNDNLAARKRGAAGARADWTVNDAVSLGFGVAYTKDGYDETVIGLNETDAWNLFADLAVVLSEQTRFHLYWQGEKANSRQTGSQRFAAPDWTGTVADKFDVYGIGIKHTAMADKLELGADLWFSRGNSNTSVQTALGEPPYPTNTTSRDVVKLYATYKLKDNLWLNGSYWYEAYNSANWHLDGVQPNTVFNLLSFGNQSPRYHQNVFRVTLRYSF